MFGRRIIPTTLEPVPYRFRTAPGVLALNYREIKALQNNDGTVFKEIANIAHAADAAEARMIYAVKKRKRSRVKLAPSTRLAMVNAVYKGRT